MSNFWDGINKNQSNNKNFNIQEFIKFSQQMRGTDPNQYLQQLINSGQISQEQFDNAKSQASGVLQMLQSIGLVKF